MKEVDLAVNQKVNELHARVEAKMKSQLKVSLVFHVEIRSGIIVRQVVLPNVLVNH